jgi:hypothetical protein
MILALLCAGGQREAEQDHSCYWLHYFAVSSINRFCFQLLFNFFGNYISNQECIPWQLYALKNPGFTYAVYSPTPLQ